MMNSHQKFLSLRHWMSTKQNVKRRSKSAKIAEGKTKKEDQAVEQAIENAADGDPGCHDRYTDKADGR